MTEKQPIRRSRTTDAQGVPLPEGSPEAAEPASAPRPKLPPRQDLRRVLDPTTPEVKAQIDKHAATSARLSELEAFASMDSLDMAALMAANPRTKPPEPGTKVSGTVIRMTQDGVLLDLGGRAEGWISRKEMPNAQPGDVVDAFVLEVDEIGGIQLSAKLTGDAAAMHLEEAKENGIPVDGKIESRNNAGYTVRVGPVRAFCPARLMSRLPPADPDALVGQTLAFLVIETGEKTVLSRRDIEEKDNEARRTERLKTLKEGDFVKAVVTNVQSWGVFLDVDGVEMMLPRREAGWEDIADLTTRFERGQRLDARVLKMELNGGRISVTTRDPSLDPWNTVTTKLTVGAVMSGRVVTQTEFGAFVEVAPGLQGLIHVSRMNKVPSQGIVLDVRILSIDTDRKRLELAPSSFDPAAQAANGVGIDVTGTVTDVAERGVTVMLADGRRAFLPGREVELTPGTTMLAQKFRVGHTLTARVMSDEKGRVTLSQKAADADDWRDALRIQAGTGMGTFADLLRKAKK
jgi:small subunit ribosomal protein S1